ncbi:Dual specificity protein phosphatase 7, partial [Stegodyphus mimosarum]
MPSLKYLNREMNSDMYITPEKLYEDIKSPDSRSLTIDCRSASDYHESHVKGAINITIPASVIMLRRLANGKMSIPSIIRGAENREKFNQQWKTHLIVLYDYDTEAIKLSGPCVLSTLFRRLRQDGCQVVCLQGGFNAFKNLMPEWLESDSAEARDSDLSLENLRITPLSESDSENEHCDSGLEGEPSPNDPPFPVEILPYLFLGNAENSADLEALQRHKIRYILNVTPNLPNAFEDKGLGIKYMKIPIQDHWSQNL